MKQFLIAGLVFGLGTAVAAPKKSKKIKKKTESTSSSKSITPPQVVSDGTIHNGLRFSVGTGNKEVKLEGRLGSSTYSDSDTGQARSFSIGYQRIRSASVEFMVELFNTAYEVDSVDFSHTGVEGNLTYGFNDKIYTYGGLGLLNITADDVSSDVDDFYSDFGTGVSLQAALGYKILDKLSAELKYSSAAFTQERSSGDDSTTADFTYTMTGLQASIIGTF